MTLVVVPVACGVCAHVALVWLLARVTQHVPLQVHALVAAVAAHAALERFGTRVNPLVPLQVCQIAAGVVTQMALVGLFARVHAMVPLQVVEVGRGVRALWTLVGLLAAVRLHVPRQVVGVVCEERAGGTCVHPVPSVPSLAGAACCVFSQHFQGALGTDLRRRPILTIQHQATQPAREREEQRRQDARWGSGARLLLRLQPRKGLEISTVTADAQVPFHF